MPCFLGVSLVQWQIAQSTKTSVLQLPIDRLVKELLLEQVAIMRTKKMFSRFHSFSLKHMYT